MLQINVKGLFLEWTIAVADFDGNETIVPLVLHGENLKVTNENKLAFVETAAQFILIENVRKQFNIIRAGFADVLNLTDIYTLHPEELSLLISGPTRINIQDWKRYTHYKGDAKQELIDGF